LQRIPSSEWDRFSDGARPEGCGDYFSRESIYACEDEEWGDSIQTLAEAGEISYEMSKLTGVGVTYFKTPNKSLAEHSQFLPQVAETNTPQPHPSTGECWL